jgi:hypothetical protein
MSMTAMTTDVWRREHEPIGSRSTPTTTRDEERSTEERTIYDVLHAILPRYDFAAIAERAEALSHLAELNRMAADRERNMPSRPDSTEEQADRTAVTEALAPGQLESMAGHDDRPDE